MTFLYANRGDLCQTHVASSLEILSSLDSLPLVHLKALGPAAPWSLSGGALFWWILC